ncbi:hypothetical protein PN836_011480 [Ningiella sp. W23]|uniref:hypothetical protein n=1 Tax=Ningiella sp. W23 TaxID=3023715 RepID=UPI003756AE0D
MNSITFVVLIVFLFMFTKTVYASQNVAVKHVPVFSDKKLLEEFGESNEYEAIEKLNARLSFDSFLMCTNKIELTRCLSRATTNEYVIFLSDYSVHRIKYEFSIDKGKSEAVDILGLNDAEAIFMKQLVLEIKVEKDKLSLGYYKSNGADFTENKIFSEPMPAPYDEVRGFTSSSYSYDIYPNGCGSPSSPLLAAAIPDWPFRAACD